MIVIFHFIHYQTEEQIIANTLDSYAMKLMENAKDLIKILDDKIHLSMRMNIESMIILDVHGKWEFFSLQIHFNLLYLHQFKLAMC